MNFTGKSQQYKSPAKDTMGDSYIGRDSDAAKTIKGIFMSDCVARITNYLSSGGLFNPELMEHEKVSTLLQDSRDKIKELEDIEKAYYTNLESQAGQGMLQIKELEAELDVASKQFIQSEKDIFGLNQHVKELEAKLVEYKCRLDGAGDKEHELEKKLVKTQACNEYHHEEMFRAQAKLIDAVEIIDNLEAAHDMATSERDGLQSTILETVDDLNFIRKLEIYSYGSEFLKYQTAVRNMVSLALEKINKAGGV